MTTFSKNVKIFMIKSDIENPKLGFESPDPGEHSETISFLRKIWMKSRNYNLAYFLERKITLKKRKPPYN